MSNTADLKKQLQDAIAGYKAALQSVANFEAKLREARKAESDALTDDSGDEKRVVKAVAESQGLQAVFSRRLELAKQKFPLSLPQFRPSSKLSPRI